MIIHVDNIVKITNSNISRYKKLGYLCEIGFIIEVLYEHIPSQKQVVYKCEYCGKEKKTTYHAYNSKSQKNICQKCLCTENFKKNLIDLTDKKFGRLLVLKKSDIQTSTDVSWDVICDCGTEKSVKGRHLNRGTTVSCGCYFSERASERITKGNKIRSGENHPNWNFDLPKHERNRRRTKTSRVVKLRNEVYKRDNYTCYICSKTNTSLNAHHILPWSKFEELRYDIDNLVTMCTECHKKYHNTYKIKEINHKSLEEFKNVYTWS